MKILLFFYILRLALCQKGIHQAKIPRWANEVTLGKFQNVLRSLSANLGTESYLVRTTSNNYVWAKGMTCVRATTRRMHDDVFNTTTSFKRSHTHWNSVHATVYPTTNYGYAYTKNGIINTEQGTGTTTYYALVFSNYRSCSIYYGPNGAHSPALDSGNYELWVTRERVKSVPFCCDFMFRYLTLGKSIREVYTSDCDGGHAGGWNPNPPQEKENDNNGIKG
uniref:Putative lipocalin n=1 Tax=Rhipicephalus microplus TaxID=6941 RepID=A0A6G5A5W2_RHIMP